jgi:hypothetical protein
MNRKIAIVIGINFLLLVSLFYITQKTDPQANIIIPRESEVVEQDQVTLDVVLNEVDTRQLRGHVEFLASEECLGRKYSTPGCEKAANYIAGELKSMGLSSERHRFKYLGNITENVYGWIEGQTDDIVVVGAHYDHLGGSDRRWYPGADDNASGTACVLEIARAFSKLYKEEKPYRTIVFQFYSAEEQGLQGSRFYVNYPKFPREKPDIDKHVFMLNLDMVGRLKSSYQKNVFSSLRLRNYVSSIEIDGLIKELGSKYTFAESITSRGRGGSDHTSFLNKRIPIAFLHTGTHNDYHKVTDTPEKLNYEGMRQISKYSIELLNRVLAADQSPSFNETGFVQQPYILDPEK